MPLPLAETNNSLITKSRGNSPEWGMQQIGSRIRNQLQRVDNICRVIFSTMQMWSNRLSQRRQGRVRVQSLGASIFQLINFIFTHLFLNALSDGNVEGCSSEVLTWQMGIKGDVSLCQRQDFNSKLRDIFPFIMHALWALAQLTEHRCVSYCAAPLIKKLHLFG